MSKLFVPESAVDASLRGFARCHAHVVELHDSPLFLSSRSVSPGRRVGLVSGGGSGHEPMHIGFVGQGMLDAAVPGRVFASPHNRQVYEASLHAAREQGVLHVVKNYTGDRINFGIAAERLARDGIDVRRVLVDDDLATERSDTGTGRRGTGATILVEKLLGGAADAGHDLEDLAQLGNDIAAVSRSVAVASRAHTAPSGGAAFDLAEGELDYGIGIHGERAATTIPDPGFEALVKRMVQQILAAIPKTSEVLLLVNGLGATTDLELYSIFDAAARILDEQDITVAGSLVGTFTPALDMSGFSITLTATQPRWLPWWFAPTRTPAFPPTMKDTR